MAIIEYLSLPKAAKISGVSVTKLYRFIHAGELKVHRRDGILVVDVKDLMRVKINLKDGELFEPTFMNFIIKVK